MIMTNADFDIFALVFCLALVTAYYVFLGFSVRRNPEFTIHTLNQKMRLRWVQEVMKDGSKDILAVQTLRNFLMAATFKASSSILLVIGTLTLSGQADTLAKAWHVLNAGGSVRAEWWTVKILCLLTVLLIAFFSFAMTIRVLNHVVFMINLPLEDAQGNWGPENIAKRLNNAAGHYSVGMRAFFAAVPLAFWLFGPLFLIGATVGLLAVLYYLDRNPLSGHE
jgi:uncharacterized membrane protein